MPQNTPNTGNQPTASARTEALYQNYLRPAVSTIVNGTRTVTGDLLNGTVDIAGDVLHFTGRAAGYTVGKAGYAVAASLYEVLNGVSGSGFGQELPTARTMAKKTYHKVKNAI